jgi:DNA-binding NarL/FixJ family response regulator
MNVLLATPFPDFRQAIARLLRENFDVSRIAEADDGHTSLALLRSGIWDIALIGVRLPVGGGLHFLTLFKAERPNLPVVMLSYDAPALVVGLSLQAGAKGYVRRDTLETALVPSVRAALSGAVCPSEEVANWSRGNDGVDRTSGLAGNSAR